MKRTQPLRTALLLHILLLGPGCASHAAPKTPEVPMPKWSGAYCEVSNPATRMAKTPAEWDALWKQAGREPPRALDSTRELAVAVFLGERRTGGYTVEIASAEVKAGKFVIAWREYTPAPDMMVTQALTQPWTIAVLARTELPVVFERLPPAPQPRRE